MLGLAAALRPATIGEGFADSRIAGEREQRLKAGSILDIR
jgi:hypothetical protein